MSVEALSGKVFLIVTGASRGLGRQIAITFGSMLEEGSRALLLARNKGALQEVAKSIPSKVTVCTISADLSKSTDTKFKEFISESLRGTTLSAFDRVVLVHNIGSIGNISQNVNDIVDLKVWRDYYDLNFFVPAVLNAVVMNTFASKTIKKTIINITTLMAIKAYVRFGQYNSVFALENPDVNVLSYSPGPIDTDMFTTVCEKIADLKSRKMFNEMKEKKFLLTTEQVVNGLVQVLNEHKYNSADRVGYYEEM
ncbi:PREDICTED: sepiapterin reductase-like isoform X2 [Wasmannia auropunctata]|uniref:sepiapterin reductase-like isoform X2 n=1 Tax=Wasmannia auropunctata TaxID=64793 RepID=UPI0005EF7693|nr:PREDICTED: sepiapterin reductase-like isoform X2 [Wasmannia auropunctata]